MAQVEILQPGKIGVNLVGDPYEPDDFSLSSAQNAQTSPIGAHSSLQKRDGISLLVDIGADSILAIFSVSAATPLYLVHTGTSLYRVTTAGVATAVTLPSGVTLSSTRAARFARLGNNIVISHAPSQNIVFDVDDNTTRKLNLTGPTGAPSATVGAAGNLTGVYRWRYTYAIVDSDDNILAESEPSDASDPLTMTADQANLTLVNSSDSDVNAKIIYRTTNGGVEYFEATRTDETTTIVIDDKSDYDLALLPIWVNRDNPPGSDSTDYFRLMTVYKNRIFASPNVDKDQIWYCDDRKITSWSQEQVFYAHPAGEDNEGVTAYMPRRNELIIAKRRRLLKLRGDGPASVPGSSPYILEPIISGIGCIAPLSAIVVRDECYFLAEDGFYKYNGTLTNLSHTTVHPWFNTDDYFNRSRFDVAVAVYNAKYDTIELHLPSVGVELPNRWVSFDCETGAWYGSHKTDAFTPTTAAEVENTVGTTTPLLGASNGSLYLQNAATSNDDDIAIDFDVTFSPIHANMSEFVKVWRQPTVINKVESVGTLDIYMTAGTLETPVGPPQSVSLQQGRTRLSHPGVGQFLTVRLHQNTLNQPVTIYALYFPYILKGRR